MERFRSAQLVRGIENSAVKQLNEISNAPGVKEFSFSKTRLRYFPIDRDIEVHNPELTTAITNVLSNEIPKADVVVIEYMPYEVSQDLVFGGGQSFRYQITEYLSAKYNKSVLAVDPAYNSQFLVDFRAIPFGLATAGGVTLYGGIRGLSEVIKNKHLSRRQLVGRGLQIAIGTTLLTGTSIRYPYDIELALSKEPRTSLLTEGMVRRVVALKGIQRYAEMLTNSPVQGGTALLVYPDWLEPALSFYTIHPDLLEQDFSKYSQLKKLPGFGQYFMGRLYQRPKKSGYKIAWDKSTFEIT